MDLEKASTERARICNEPAAANDEQPPQGGEDADVAGADEAAESGSAPEVAASQPSSSQGAHLLSHSSANQLPDIGRLQMWQMLVLIVCISPTASVEGPGKRGNLTCLELRRKGICRRRKQGTNRGRRGGGWQRAHAAACAARGDRSWLSGDRRC